MADPLRATKVCDAIVVNMVDVGEETGDLDKMLIKVADNYDNDVDVLVGSLISILEPVMVVILGVIVGFIVIALFCPMISPDRRHHQPARRGNSHRRHRAPRSAIRGRRKETPCEHLPAPRRSRCTSPTPTVRNSRPGGFTLVETAGRDRDHRLLMSILIPAVSAACRSRRTSRTPTRRDQQIGSARGYYKDFHAYPGRFTKARSRTAGRRPLRPCERSRVGRSTPPRSRKRRTCARPARGLGDRGLPNNGVTFGGQQGRQGPRDPSAQPGEPEASTTPTSTRRPETCPRPRPATPRAPMESPAWGW